MPVANPNYSNGARQAPGTEAKQAPKNDARKSQDSTAAKQAPRETRSAVESAFGKVPQNGNAKQPAQTPKAPANGTKQTEPRQPAGQPLAATPPRGNRSGPKTSNLATEDKHAKDDAKAPSDDTKTADDNAKAPADDTKTAGASAEAPARPGAPPADAPKAAPDPDARTTPPVDPKVQEILDSRLPDGKTVKEKIDADAPAYILKAAQDHYNKQIETGEALDSVSKFYLNNVARGIIQNGVVEENVEPEKLEGVFNREQIDKNLAEIAKDPDFIKWSGEQQANSIQNTIEKNPDIAKLVDPFKQEGENYVNVLRRMQSDYMGTQEFADGVAKARTPEESKALLTEGLKTLSSLGLGEKEMLGVGNTLAENIRSKYTPDAPKPVIDPNTNKPIQTEDGNSLATLPDGTPIALQPDGKAVVDKDGNAWVYNLDGTARVDAGNKYVQYDAKARATYANYDGTRYMVGPDGNGRYDTQNRPLAIDKDGGAPIALDKDGKAVSDKAGRKLVFDPATGKALTDPDSGNQVVIDPLTKAVVQTDSDGKIIAGKNGDPYSVDQSTGKFVVDAQGRYVQISKDNLVPGILPGYVVDENNTKVVVGPYNGKPMVDPKSGATVVIDPKTNGPELVPLDANGAPRLAQDGNNILIRNGNTVVANTDGGADWLVDQDGKYAQDGNGNYIAVDGKSGLAAAVDAKGEPLKNANGHVPLWDPKTQAPMKTGDGGANIVVDDQGNLLATDAEGYVLVDPDARLPYLIDAKTRGAYVNAESGRSILLDQSGLPVDYNPADGYKYLINPKTRTAVKNAEGNPVVMAEIGVPYAVNPDGSPVQNPETGNTVVYDIAGNRATDKATGFKVEFTANGKVNLIDPKTRLPVGRKDPVTGGYQLLDKDGTEQTNPDTGNKIQRIPGSGSRVEIDPSTKLPVKDANGNIMLMGPDNRALKTPDGKAVVADKTSGAPVAVDANGKVVTDPASGLPQVVNTSTGVPLADPVTGAPVVVDKVSGAPVQADPATGKTIKDPVTDQNILANTDTGEQVKGPSGEPIVLAPEAKLPVYADKQTNTLVVFDLSTGKPRTNPDTGAKVVIAPDGTGPVEVLDDGKGQLVLVDSKGKPLDDGKGNVPYLDQESGQVTIKDQAGNLVDPGTGKEAKAADLKEVVKQIPFSLLTLSRRLPGASGQPSDPVPGGDPADAPPAGDGSATVPAPETNNIPDLPPWLQEDWNQPGYTTTPEERAEYVQKFKRGIKGFAMRINESIEEAIDAAEESGDPEKIAAANKLKDIPVEDLIALTEYTGRDSYEINKALLTGDPALLEKWRPQIKATQSAINHLKNIGYGLHDGPAVRYMSLTPEEITNLFPQDGYFRNPAFMSTSANTDFAVEGMENMNVKLKINRAIGVNISAFSFFPEQDEVIVSPGELFKNGAINDWDAGSSDLFGIRVEGKEVPITQEVPGATKPEIPGTSGTTNEVQTPVVPDTTDAVDVLSVEDAAANASKWSRLGKTLSYGLDALDLLGSSAQVVLGGLDIANGVKTKDGILITEGVLNSISGGLGLASGVSAIIGGAVAGAALPLAALSFIVGGIVGIVHFAGMLDDDEQFADKLEKDFGPLGILQEGWRPKAEEAHRDGNWKHVQPNYIA